MLTFLKTIFKRNIKFCAHCGCGINPKKDAALCLHGDDEAGPFEQWICQSCCEKIAYEYDQDFGDEVKIAEED